MHRIDVPLLPVRHPLHARVPSAWSPSILRDERVDVAHFHGGIVSPLAYFAAYSSQAAGIPTVITTHCLWSYATPAFALLDRDLPLARLARRAVGGERRGGHADPPDRRAMRAT